MASKKLPFIYKFKTANENYVYDVNTNRVFVVNDVLFDIVDIYPKTKEYIKKYFPKHSISSIEKALQEFNQAQKDGFFSAHRPIKMAFLDDTLFLDTFYL